MLFLASASPRRSALLHQLGVAFEVIADCAVDETPLKNETPAAYVARLACAKAEAGRRQLGHDDGWVLGADTCVIKDGQLLGKAADRQAAHAMLTQLAGGRHQVLTSVCLLQGARQLFQTGSSDVVFEQLTASRLEAYLDTGEWQGKAGSYAIQGYAAAFVRELVGSYSNVVGLPLFETAQLLRAAGIAYWQR